MVARHTSFSVRARYSGSLKMVCNALSLSLSSISTTLLNLSIFFQKIQEKSFFLFGGATWIHQCSMRKPPPCDGAVAIFLMPT